MINFADRIGSRWRWLALRRTAWRGAIYVLPLAVLFAAATARVAAPDLLDRMSLICFDLYQRAAPRKPEGGTPIRIVDIDDDSLKKIGQWPWPRTLVAQLIDKLREAGASVVAFDFDFAEPDRTSPKLLLPLIAQNGDGSGEAEKLLAALPDPDQRLAAAMGTVPTVTGFILTNHGEARPPAAKAGFAFAGDDPVGQVDSFPAAVANLPALEAVAAGNGFLNQYPDWDHVVRRVPLILKLGDKPYPSLAAEALRVAFGGRSYVGRAAGANGEKNFGEKTGLTAIRVGQVTVPTDAAGRVWLYYAPPRTDRFVSAADVLAGNFDPALFAGHIVLVGTSAAGVINDRQATPIARDVPGVEIHAQLIEQILQGAFLVRPDWAVGAEILFTLLCGIGLILGVSRIGALPSAILGAAAVVTAVGISWLAFRQAQLLIDPVYPWAVISVVYLVASLLGYLRTEARQREIRNAFSRYMSPHYVQELAAHPEKLVLGGETRTMTIMFSDIRGFTSLAEGMDARTLTKFMNSFLSPMTEIITEQKGTIDKYIGDCVMAFWNAPLDDPEHARNAVRAAQAMRRKLAELNRGWESEALAAGKSFEPVKIGIGINTGECVVGNFGSQEHFDYSLLGDPVNLASRLEGLGKVYGVDLVIGEETAARLADPALIEIDIVAVKGKTQAGRIYTLPPEPVEQEQFIDRHSALLRAYRRQDWAAALRLLDDGLLAATRHLAPVYDLYRRRIAQFQIEAPPQNWDGVFTAEEK
jgi:adenylate cyclase